MKLTIAIITWNRSKQLEDALHSCVNCALPDDTQFVIVDSASTDDTRIVSERFSKQCPYPIKTHFSNINLGVGEGRNKAFSISDGAYVYFMDDDAYIDSSQYSSFFSSAIEILDQNPKIATLTTQIYDLVWKGNRVNKAGPYISPGISECFMFCGGSHFLRKAFFQDKDGPYYPTRYGYEELLPSLVVTDSGFYNGFVPSLTVIHNPKENKWQFSNIKNEKVLISEIANQKGIKSRLYPKSIYPLVYLAYKLRCIKYLDNHQRKISDEWVHKISALGSELNRVQAKTIIKSFFKYGFSIF